MRLIDADELINIIIYVSEEYVNRPDVIEIKGLMIEMLNESPTVDAVPVVRCDDCCHRYENEEGVYVCNIWLDAPCGDDDFCSYGVKMDEGETQ